MTLLLQVVAELARELGEVDPASGLQPPSIRSLQFLLPNFVLPASWPPLPEWALGLIPDLKLPLWLMTQRPPDD